MFEIARGSLAAMAFLTFLTAVATETTPDEYSSTKSPIKRSYVCPPNFVRLSSKCYFFSKKMATWQEAYWRCRDLHGNLAVIRNAHQDKLIRRTLDKDTLVPLERWLGGIYDWEQMAWKWAASAKAVQYNGFPPEKLAEDKENLRWHCITVDPSLDYRWNSRSCFERKHFICHTKIKIVSNREKKKLQRQYNADNSNRLNEIPVPELPEDNPRNSSLKVNRPDGVAVEDGEEESNELRAQFAQRARAQKRKRKGRRRKQQKVLEEERRRGASDVAAGNATRIYEVPRVKQGKHKNANRRRRNKSREQKEASIENIRWRTYYSSATKSPLHPRRIVEEFSFSKK